MSLNLKNKIQKSINQGVSFLAREQEKDGSFLCLVSSKLDDYKAAKTCPAIVPSNIILSSLIKIPETKQLKAIKDKIADFLLAEKGSYWSYNYWFRASPEYISLPYPDDLDDTFCALAALYEYRPEVFDGETMARIATMLTSAEEKEGGPYDMWLVPPDGRSTWKDTDLVVNSNIAYFLSLQDISLPGLDTFINQCIQKKKYAFPYCGDYPGLYFISRFYKGKHVEKMITYILSKRETNGSWGNPLHTALAISALLNLSKGKMLDEVIQGIKYLLSQQSKGGWKSYSFFFQMRTKEKTVYAGSATITTALCLEALNAYNSYLKKQSVVRENESASQEICNQVISSVEKRFSHFDSSKKEALRIVRKIAKDKNVVLLPYLFKQALGERAQGVSDELIVKLAQASVYGWVAYTIYDDFFDGVGDPQLLSIANTALRESANIFSTVLPAQTGFGVFSQKIFDLVDDANAWEVTNCRFSQNTFSKIRPPDFGDYSVLAHKSIGHVLAPLSILFNLGYTERSSEVKQLLSFFKHYLIARQLDDDVHDWEEDFTRGCVTPVVALLVKDTKKGNLEIKNMQHIFWQKTVVSICNEIVEHCVLARQNHIELAGLLNVSFLESIITPIEQSAYRALIEHKDTSQFLGVFKDRGMKA